MAYFGYLTGHRYAYEATQDPAGAALLIGYMNREATPTGIDLTEYRVTPIERFSKPATSDTLARLRAESTNRIPKWLLPVCGKDLAAGRAGGLAAAIARAGPAMTRA